MIESIENNLNDGIENFKYDDLQNEKISLDFTESLFTNFLNKKNDLNSSKNNLTNINKAIQQLNLNNISNESSKKNSPLNIKNNNNNNNNKNNNNYSYNNSPNKSSKISISNNSNNSNKNLINNNFNNDNNNNNNYNNNNNNNNNNFNNNNYNNYNYNNNNYNNNYNNNNNNNNNNNINSTPIDPTPLNLSKISKIQSTFKSHLSLNHFTLLRTSIFILQRAYRHHLIKKYNLPSNFYYNDKFLKLQTEIYEENYKNNLSILFPALFVDKTDINSFTKNLMYLTNNPNRNPYESQKIILFSKILDFDMMINTDETYEELWSLTYEKLYSKCLKNFDPIQNIQIGSQHTICLSTKGKIFSFGWNNYGQCGIDRKKTIVGKEELNGNESLVEINKFNELKPKVINKINGFKMVEIENNNNNNFYNNNNNNNFYNNNNNNFYNNNNIEFKSIICGEDHSITLDTKGNVYTFGINLNGQLGLNHNHPVSHPSKIKSLFNIKEINSAGYINFAVNKNGDGFIWPYTDKTGTLKFSPAKILLNEKINNISCGNNFCLILTNSGLLYSMGKSNKYGQLGTGDYSSHLSPILIEYFLNSNERITQISCGFKHSVAKTSLGKVYTWGANSKGQLGNNSYNNLTIPGIVKFDDNFMKVFQISAGFRCTFFLCENRKVYCCGCNGTISMEKIPVLFDIIDKVPEMAIESNYSVVRILNTWNKSFSVFYCTIADSSNMKINPVKLNGILNKLSAKWENNENKPPYVESIEKYFDIGTMRKENEGKYKN